MSKARGAESKGRSEPTDVVGSDREPAAGSEMTFAEGGGKSPRLDGNPITASSIEAFLNGFENDQKWRE